MDFFIIESIFSTSIWLILFAIYLKSPKHSYNGENILHRGIGTKSAMQSEYHWEYAQTLGVNLLYALAGISLIINSLICFLFLGNVISETVYMFSDIIVVLVIGATIYFVLENTLKNLPVNANTIN